MDQKTNDEINYYVVKNEEDQYSIWPSYKKDIPLGWSIQGEPADKKICLEYIKKVWTDMRPKSLRDAMDKKIEDIK